MFPEQTAVLLSLCARVSCVAAGNSLSMSAWRLLWSKIWKKKKKSSQNPAHEEFFFLLLYCLRQPYCSLKKLFSNASNVFYHCASPETNCPLWMIIFLLLNWIELNWISHLVKKFQGPSTRAKHLHMQHEEYLPQTESCHRSLLCNCLCKCFIKLSNTWIISLDLQIDSLSALWQWRAPHCQQGVARERLTRSPRLLLLPCLLRLHLPSTPTCQPRC